MTEIRLGPDCKFEFRDRKTLELIAMGTVVKATAKEVVIGIDAPRNVEINQYTKTGKRKRKFGRF